MKLRHCIYSIFAALIFTIPNVSAQLIAPSYSVSFLAAPGSFDVGTKVNFTISLTEVTPGTPAGGWIFTGGIFEVLAPDGATDLGFHIPFSGTPPTGFGITFLTPGPHIVTLFDYNFNLAHISDAGLIDARGFGGFVGGGPTVTVDIGNLSPVPEPETYAMLLAGLVLLGFVARRRKQK
jgi:hypothetical protein